MSAGACFSSICLSLAEQWMKVLPDGPRYLTIHLPPGVSLLVPSELLSGKILSKEANVWEHLSYPKAIGQDGEKNGLYRVIWRVAGAQGSVCHVE